MNGVEGLDTAGRVCVCVLGGAEKSHPKKDRKEKAAGKWKILLVAVGNPVMMGADTLLTSAKNASAGQVRRNPWPPVNHAAAIHRRGGLGFSPLAPTTPVS